MRRPFVIALLIINILVWGSAGALLLYPRIREVGYVLPTLAVLPSLTPTATWTLSRTPSVTPTFTPTDTSTLAPTLIPTSSPTLATRVLEISAVMPGVYLPPTPTPFPFGMTILPAPPDPFEPLPDATNTAPPFTGWFSFESDYPTVSYSPPWTPRLSQFASRGQYHRTEDLNGRVTFPFEGEGLRVRYVAAENMGRFDILVDGILLDTIDAYADTLLFPGTRVYYVGAGQHRLDLRVTGKNSASSGYVIGLDAVQVFRGDASTLILPPYLSPTSTNTPQVAERIELIAAPPTLQPTPTPAPPGIARISVVIAYDENGNGAVDPAEGVAGISVRVVETNTNEVIASGFTDARGYAFLEVIVDQAARVVVPYFGETWDISTGRSGENTFTLLLDAANQPGLIP